MLQSFDSIFRVVYLTLFRRLFKPCQTADFWDRGLDLDPNML